MTGSSADRPPPDGAANEYSPATNKPDDKNMSKTENQSASELAEKIEALEDRQRQQAQTIQELRNEISEVHSVSAEDEQGRSWDLQSLMDIGLTRRAAMVAIGVMLTGGTLVQAIGTAEAAGFNDGDGQIGDSNSRFDWYADAIDTNLVNYNGLTPDYRLESFRTPTESSDQSTTSTSYTQVLLYHGHLKLDQMPSALTLYGRLKVRVRNDTSNESVSVRPRIYDGANGTYRNLTSLELSGTSTSDTVLDSGWTDISGDIDQLSALHRAPSLEMKVSGGTGTVNYQSTQLDIAGSYQ